ARIRGPAAGRHRRDEAPQPSVRAPPAHLDAQAPERARHRRDAAHPGGRRSRDSLPRRMRFEKWNALGNDYVIVEQDDLPFELTPERVRRLCAHHSGIGSDGVLLLSKPESRGFVAHLRIFNPDGSEAELSGNGAREAILYLRRRGWTDSDTFSIETGAGEVRPTITSETTCTRSEE